MAALGGLSPRMRARVQKIVLKVKLSFSETSQVPGAAGDTVRILFCLFQKNRQTVAQHWPPVPGWLGGEPAWAFSPEMGNSAQRLPLYLRPWPLGSTLKLRCSC